MDDLLEAFLSGENVRRQTISGGTTNGRLRMEYEQPNYIDDKVPEQTKKYAKPFVEQLKHEVWKVKSCTKFFIRSAYRLSSVE